MSTTSQQDDWRAQALQNMERPEPTEEEKALSKQQEQAWLGYVLVKLAFLILFSVALIWFGGFGWLFALVLVAWYLFWPR